MSGVLQRSVLDARPGMAKRKQTDEGTASQGRQVNFRAQEDLFARLNAVGKALGLDMSNLVRMILYEQLAVYEARVAQIQGKSTCSEE
jgi:hypothetical protein